MDNDESQIAQEKSGENRRPVFHPCGANQQKSNRECKERRAEAGPFGVRIVRMVMMKLMKASADRRTVEDRPMHQIFQQRPGHRAHQNQIEAIDTGQVHENRDGKRYGDEVTEVSKSPHHVDGQSRNERCSTQWITSAAQGAAFPHAVDLQADWNRFT